MRVILEITFAPSKTKPMEGAWRKSGRPLWNRVRRRAFGQTSSETKEFAMHLFSKIAFAVLVGGSAIAVTATGATARIVCNGEGDCWHPRGDFEFVPAAGVTIHPDNWRWRKDEHFAWREHEGRGYWRGGRWTEF
jgi:hypothetical protein